MWTMEFVWDGSLGAVISYWDKKHDNPSKHFTFELVKLPLGIA